MYLSVPLLYFIIIMFTRSILGLILLGLVNIFILKLFLMKKISNSKISKLNAENIKVVFQNSLDLKMQSKLLKIEASSMSEIV